MARTRRRVGAEAAALASQIDSPGAALLEQAQAVAAKVSRLRRDFSGAHRLAHQAQVREALTRTELTVALTSVLAARSRLEARVRDQALQAYRARGGGVRLRRHNRVSQALDRLLARLGPPGQAAVIARSGVWGGAGGLRGLLQMASYALRGPNPVAVPRTFFDQAWYLSANPDVGFRRIAPLVHYLVTGSREGRSPAALFDESFYRRQNAEVLAANSLTGLEHYVRTGAAEGRTSHPLFEVGHYLAQAPELAPGEAPLAHYLRAGSSAGLSPHPLFDPAWYASRAKVSVGAVGLAHYLTSGWRAGLSPHPLFEPAWYLAQNPEVAQAGVEPLTHFVAFGGEEGRNPSPWFDTAHYLDLRGDGRPPGVNPLVDYLRGGAWAVSEARPGFPTAAYLASWPAAMARSGLTPLEHWARQSGR